MTEGQRRSSWSATASEGSLKALASGVVKCAEETFLHLPLFPATAGDDGRATRPDSHRAPPSPTACAACGHCPRSPATIKSD